MLHIWYKMMSKSMIRTYSRYTKDAVSLLGGLIRAARKEQKRKTQTLADQAGISRNLLYRIETGDPSCAIGVVFEVATLLGIQLFEMEPNALTRYRRQTEEKLALLPKAIHDSTKDFNDDF